MLPSAFAVRRRRMTPVALVGWGAIGLAVVVALIAPPTLLSFALGIVAVIGISRERRLGIAGAALVALITIPYGRAADIDLASVFGVPLRFADGVVLAALILSIPRVRATPLSTWTIRLFGLFLVIGVVALAVGIMADHALRDILRDARWWFLYGYALVAVAMGADRRQIIRGIVLGACGFSVVLLLVATVPLADGSLRDRALTYDWNRLRLQFSNSVFLIPAAAYFAAAWLQRGRAHALAGLTLVLSAVVLSVTRMSVLAVAGAVALTAILAAAVLWRQGRVASLAVRLSLMLGSVSLGVALAIATIQVGSPEPVVPAAGPVDPGEDPGSDSATDEAIGRLLFQDPSSDIAAINGGRFRTYADAVALIRRAPMVGDGLGTLTPVEFTFGGASPSTPGFQPGVDNAYLTVALKAGIVGMVVFALLMLLPLWIPLNALWGNSRVLRRDRAMVTWFVAGWLGILALTMTQSFATTGYGPLGLGLLIVVGTTIGARRTSRVSRR